MADKPRLLVLTSSFPRNVDDETCSYVSELSRRLSKRFDVTVLAPTDPEVLPWPKDDFVLVRSKSLVPAGLNEFQATRDLNDVISGGVIEKLRLSISLLGYFVSAFRLGLKSDVVLSHWLFPSGLIASIVCRLLNKPHVAVEHSGALHLLSRLWGGRLIARTIARCSRRLIFVSGDLRAKFLNLVPSAANKSGIVSMGVDAKAFSRKLSASDGHGTILSRTSEASARRILFIGRLTQIKGVEVLLESLSRLTNVSLVVAGEGPLRQELESLANQLGVDATFLGRIGAAERLRLLRSADIVAIPSLRMPDGRSEGTPVVCLEAMAAGCAIVASRTGGLAEIIDDGENGLLVEPGNVDFLTVKMESLLADESFRLRLGERALETASKFDWKAITKQFEHVLESVLTDEQIHHNSEIRARSARA